MGHPKDKERGITQQNRGLPKPERSRVPEINIGFPKALVPLPVHKSEHPQFAQDINDRAAEEEAFEYSQFLLDQNRGKGDRGFHQRALLLLADNFVKGAGSANVLSQKLKLHIQNNTPPRLFNEKDAELLIRTAFEKFKEIHQIPDRDFVWIWTFTLIEEYKKAALNRRYERIGERTTEIEKNDLWSIRVHRLAKEANISYEFAELLLIEYDRLQGLPTSRTQVINPKFYHGIQGGVSGQRQLFSATTGVTIGLPLIGVTIPYLIANPLLTLKAILAILEAESLVAAMTGESVLLGGKLKAWERVLNVAFILIPLCSIARLSKYAGAGIQIGKTLSKKAGESAKFIAGLAYKSGGNLVTIIKNAKRLGGMSGQQANRLWRTTRASIANKKPLKITQLERVFVKELDDAVRQFQVKGPSPKTPHKATKRPSQDDISLERTFQGGLNEGLFETAANLKRGNFGERIATDALAKDGHIIIDFKPSILGTNQGGIDMVTMKNGVVHLIDNKALTRSGNVSSVSALTDNFGQNLRAVKQDLASVISHSRTIPEQRRVLQGALDALNRGDYLKVVTNANLLGRSPKVLSGVTEKLSDEGIVFIDVIQ